MRSVLLIRPDRNDADAAALTAAGWDVTIEPWLEVRASRHADQAADLCARLATADQNTWLVLTSPRAWSAFEDVAGAASVQSALASGLAGGLRVAAVGQATADTLPHIDGITTPPQATAAALTAMLDAETPGTLLWPTSTIARETIPRWAAAHGWSLHRADVYETTPVEERPASARAVTAGEFDAIVLRSPSAAQALGLFATVPPTMMVVAVGPSTAEAAQALPGRVVTCDVLSADTLATTMEHL